MWVVLPGANANPLNARSALYGVDASTGVIKFSTFTVIGAVIAPLTVDATAVYTCGYQAYVQATAIPGYSVRWSSYFRCGYRSPMRVASSPGVINGGVGFVISAGVPFPSYFNILNPASGASPAGGDLPEYGADGAGSSVVNGVWYAGSMESLGGGAYASSVYAFAPQGTF